MGKESFLKSMTAYGRGVATCDYGRFTIELQSVNRRYLEINVNLPRQLTRFEMDVRKIIGEHVGRGMVQAQIHWRPEGTQPLTVTPNLTLARGVKKAWEKILLDLGLETSVPLALLAQEKELLLHEEEIGEETLYRTALEEALVAALTGLVTMKKSEGSLLVADLQKRRGHCQALLEKIELHAPEASEKFRQKLSERLEELFSGSPENEEKVLREIALFSERADVTEEIVRMKSHLEQFDRRLHQPLETPTETRGKGLDFLLQEMNREVNTIGSKGAQIAVSEAVVELKGELEKMREQVQNIE